jgi:hypothetical protein
VLQGRPWDEVPDYHRDQLRWAWRKFCLDRDKPAAWDAMGRAIMLDLASRGPVETDDLSHATGSEPHVLFVERRATAFEWAVEGVGGRDRAGLERAGRGAKGDPATRAGWAAQGRCIGPGRYAPPGAEGGDRDERGDRD